MKALAVLLMMTVFVPVSHAEFTLGICTHVSILDMQKPIDAIKASKSNAIRQDLPWSDVEKEKGKYEYNSPRMWTYFTAIASAGLAPLIILDYGNKFYDNNGKPVSKEAIGAFARYAHFTAKAASGKGDIFEIWNEWDQSAEPKSAESYFDLVKAAAPAIKAANKDTIILAGAATTGGIRSGWVEKLVKLGVLKYIDGISIHPYIHCERDKSPEAWIKFISETSAQLKIANGGNPVPLYVTEMGWPSHNGACGTSPGTVAQYLTRALLLVRSVPEIKGLWWYDLRDDSNNIQDPEFNFGLLNVDFIPKPAFAAFRDVAPYITAARAVVRKPAPNGIVSLEITGNSGNKSFALWIESGKSLKISLSIAKDHNAVPTITKVGVSKIIGGNVDSLNLTLDGTPQIITGIQSLSIL